MLKIYIACLEKKDYEKLKSICDSYEAENIIEPTEYYLSYTHKGKKQAKRLKSHWSARIEPFILIEKDNKAVKAFYSEASKDIIEDFKHFMQYELDTI